MMEAVLSNADHPEYGVATIPLPIPRNQYDHCVSLLEALEIGGASEADCRLDSLDSAWPVLNRLVCTKVNLDELDYLAKRLDSFTVGEFSQFQAMAEKLNLASMKDLINLTFCCQQATVITDFTNLKEIGRDHYMNIHGGCASMEELEQLDGEETAILLIEDNEGTVTRYGVVYDNGMQLSQLYDGKHLPCYHYEADMTAVGISPRREPENSKNVTWVYGYTLQDHSIRIVEEQAVIVQRIFKEYLSGKSTERIASDLREEGIPCKSGEVAWDSTAIRYIISNEKYIGDSVWQKYFSTDTLPYKCRLNRGQKVSYYAYGTHEGIVPKEDFEKANALMKSRAQKITLTKNSPYAFRKKIVCGDCQSLFRRKVVRGITYWVCIGHDKKRHGLKCGITPIAEDEITNAFIRLYYKLKHHGEPILMGMTTSLQAIRNRRMLWSLDVIELNKQISNLTSQNQMLATLKQQGLIDPDIFIAQSNELTEQLRAVKLKKERLLAVDGDNTISQTRELMEILDDGPDFLDSFDAELFGELVETIIVESNERIRFRLKNGLELSETIERTVR